MLRRVRLHTLPVSQLVRPRSQFSSKTIHNNFRQPQPAFLQQQARRHFHYDPNAVVFQLPLKTRLKYMAYGGLWLVLLAGGSLYWRLNGLYGQRDELEHHLKTAVADIKEFQDKFLSGFAEARRDGDHHRLRRLTFELLRGLHKLDDGGAEERLPEYFSEFGELPGLPFDDPMSGRELVPREDTLVLLEKDEMGVISTCFVGVNVELSEVYRGLADPRPEPEADKLSELFRRVGDQIKLWQRQGRLYVNETGELDELDLVILFNFRDNTWAFEYADGHWNSLSGPVGVLQNTESVARAEEMLEAMSKEGKTIFGKKPRP